VVEHTQAKHSKTTTTLALWKREREKAVAETETLSPGGDFFMLFTTQKSKVAKEDLPPRGGIVSADEFDAYFGPYAARAFCAVKVKRNVNKCTYEQLLEAQKRYVQPKNLHKYTHTHMCFSGKNNTRCSY
jgi:hypothetical protein